MLRSLVLDLEVVHIAVTLILLALDLINPLLESLNVTPKLSVLID